MVNIGTGTTFSVPDECVIGTGSMSVLNTNKIGFFLFANIIEVIYKTCDYIPIYDDYVLEIQVYCGCN